MLTAICRDVCSEDLARCELTCIDRAPIDAARFIRQHDAYVEALSSTPGVRVLQLPCLLGHPDAHFVEDAAIVLDEVAICTRPGALSRRDEVDSIALLLSTLLPNVERIVEPGTLDGGDVLVMCERRVIFVGQSTRTNRCAFDQLQSITARFGYKCIVCPVQHCLHLKLR